MVKVGSMRKANRILLVTTLLVLSANSIEAGLWRSRKAKTSSEKAPASAAVTLTAIESEPNGVLLRTSGAPSYTSYSPSPHVFVVDLSGATRGADLAIPANLAPSIASIAAEEAVEMGARLTRVTFRFTGETAPEATANPAGVAVVFAAPHAAEVAVVPGPAPVEPSPEPIVETARVVEEPAVVLEPVPAEKARQLKSVETAGSGDALEVRIKGDGALVYKAFRLDGPARLVVDLAGVKNSARASTVPVDGNVVRAVRVAQFKGGADPVARVVIDLASKSEYTITPDGTQLRVRFGNALVPAVTESAVQRIEVPAAAPARPAPARTIEEIPAVAENAPTWRMPARQVISSAADQVAPEPPRTTTTLTATPQTEDVFAQQTTPSGLQTMTNMTGANRTLSSQGRVFSGDPISLNLKDADIRDVLRTFAQLTGLNIAVDPQVTGRVTVDFVDVPWDQALDIILRQNGLTFILEGNVMRVGTAARIAQEQAAAAALAEQERLNVALTTVSFKLSYARAQEVATLVRDIASPRAKIIIDQRTNLLIISEIPAYLQTIRNLIDTVDVANKQVVIEARIVETTKIFSRAWGFSWSFGGDLDPALGTGTGLVFPNRIGFNGGPFEFGPGNRILGLTLTDVLGTFTLDLALNAAENESLARIISAPRVTTQDNTAAEIQSGVQIPYQTRVNFTTTVSYIDATLRLSVTPQITEAGTIIMDIQVQKTTPGQPLEGAAGVPLNTRQARTRLMVRDGGTAVIGGIYQAQDTTGQSRVPVLHQLPVIGNLFRSNSRNLQHDELLIFITPRIVRG